MNNKQLIAIILLFVSFFTIYLGYEKSKPSLGESIIENSVDFLNKFSNNPEDKILYRRTNNGIHYYIGGGLLGLLAVIIFWTESKKSPKNLE